MPTLYLCLRLNVRAHTCMSVVSHAAQIAVLHTSQLQRAAADSVETLTSATVDTHWVSVLVELRRLCSATVGSVSIACNLSGMLDWCGFDRSWPKYLNASESRRLCEGGVSRGLIAFWSSKQVAHRCPTTNRQAQLAFAWLSLLRSKPSSHLREQQPSSWMKQKPCRCPVQLD